MKVERQKVPFEPVVITLYSPADVRALYHMVNCAGSMSLDEYFTDQCRNDKPETADFQWRLYLALESIFSEAKE